MNLSKRNLFARYYNWIYEELPQDFCTFFWGLLFAILFSILVVPGRVACTKHQDRSFGAYIFAGFMVWLITGVVIFTGNLILDSFGYQFTNLWGLIFGGLGLGILTFAVVLLILVLIVGPPIVIADKVKGSVTWQNTKDGFAAVKGKYCTPIYWQCNEKRA